MMRPRADSLSFLYVPLVLAALAALLLAPVFAARIALNSPAGRPAGAVAVAEITAGRPALLLVSRADSAAGPRATGCIKEYLDSGNPAPRPVVLVARMNLGGRPARFPSCGPAPSGAID